MNAQDAALPAEAVVTQSSIDNTTPNQLDAYRQPLNSYDEQAKQNKAIPNSQNTINPSAEDLVKATGFADAQEPADSTISENTANTIEKLVKYKAACNVFSSVKLKKGTLNDVRTNFCDQISKRLASVTNDACMAAKLEPSGCDSVNGVPLMVREFAPLDDKQNLGRVLVIGGVHGDELTSVSVTFRWIETLNKYHSGLFHWHLIPAMNPDGLFKRAAKRTNQNGVDLNRNMPSQDWEQNALNYWKTKGGKNPRKYPGEAANSEPETQWLVDEINLFKPDAIIAIHAPYGMVDFDAHKLNTAPKSLGKLRLNLLGTYPGSLGNYAGINLNIPVITLELSHASEMPSEKESTLIWEDIVQWLKKNLNSTQTASAAE